MKKIKFTRSQIIFALLSVAVMVVIFMFSREDAEDSSQTSGFFTTILLRILYRGYDGFTPEHQAELLDQFSHFVRKTAHFTVYTALGFCTSFTAGKRKLISWGSLAAIGVCFLYACSDEIHQYFVPGRACMFTDVLIDTCGSLTGMVISMGIMAIICKRVQSSELRVQS